MAVEIRNYKDCKERPASESTLEMGGLDSNCINDKPTSSHNKRRSLSVSVKLSETEGIK